MGVSAFRGRNAKVGALAGFLKAVETGQVKPGSALIIESLDRLSRDEVGEALELFLGLLRRKIAIVTLVPEEIFDRGSINNPVQLIVAIVIMSRAYEESAIKSERVGQAWKEKKQRAQW